MTARLVSGWAQRYAHRRAELELLTLLDNVEYLANSAAESPAYFDEFTGTWRQ